MHIIKKKWYLCSAFYHILIVKMLFARIFALHPDGEVFINSLITIDIPSMVSPGYVSI